MYIYMYIYMCEYRYKHCQSPTATFFQGAEPNSEETFPIDLSDIQDHDYIRVISCLRS